MGNEQCPMNNEDADVPSECRFGVELVSFDPASRGFVMTANLPLRLWKLLSDNLGLQVEGCLMVCLHTERENAFSLLLLVDHRLQTSDQVHRALRLHSQRGEPLVGGGKDIFIGAWGVQRLAQVGVLILVKLK